MVHDPRWCHEHGVEVWQFRVPDSGQRVDIPVTSALVTVISVERVMRTTTARARQQFPEAVFRRRLLPTQSVDGEFVWRQV